MLLLQMTLLLHLGLHRLVHLGVSRCWLEQSASAVVPPHCGAIRLEQSASAVVPHHCGAMLGPKLLWCFHLEVSVR